MIRTSDGQEVFVTDEVFAPAGDIEIGAKDRVTLPNGDQPPILGQPLIYTARDGSKVQHVRFRG